jgi:hypothetical protein
VGQSVVGTDVAVDVTEGELTARTSPVMPRRRKVQVLAPPAGSYPPEVGPGATVGTLEQGYPLLQCEDTVTAQLSLVAR